ncbi:vWA domain-containing protein [Natronorubrum bangense]|uniref:VWA domain-containing protein n=1 Tax=Natronorubrum bangense TaxID=61858 RepID=A0A4D6HJI1_9EURY|nr:vWA domain-containing protein [Natronorubrum bangense]QCC54364.1 VWA domain-containing protein [Natronorubrum bangense]
MTVTVTATAEHDDERTAEATQELRVDLDDVILDRPNPDEYQEVAVSNDSSGVAVDVGGDGLHESDISVRDETPAADDPYRAGPMVRIESQQEFDEATVAIPLEEDALEREGNLSVVTWDPQSDEPWTPVETEIDVDEGVATADVDGFSFFSVFWIDDWEDETSDTITLDGNETDGDVGDGGSLEKADFTFVVDVSGSMSGSPISYARDAATRFVGALADDEQAGLVSFESSASREHPLTRDHDALNSSIESLSAGGGTHTEAGIREGLEELEANGWENRSSVMILLADGKSSSYSDAESAAEDAADAGVEISTVGLGNSIDENELREIAAITGGDFHHVQHSEDLPDTFERVAENQTGVDLEDTNGDGIPDLVAEMDLRMPTGPGDVQGEPLDLDPVALDTSGDGIQDNETVDINYRVHEEDNETKLTAQVTHAAHHPAMVDTTGDGLTDAEQLEGWEIEVVDDPDAAQNLEDLVTDPDVDGDPMSYFSSRNVTASPLVVDTDGDGLTDIEERELGTDPERLDTTGDGISDDDAFDDPEEDPTVFSTSPPEATLLEYDQWSEMGSADVEFSWSPVEIETPSWNFRYQFRLEDPAGIDAYELERGGRTVGADDDVGGYTSITRTETLDSLTEGSFSALRGSETTIEATDVYGNAGGERIHGQSSFYGDVIGTNVDPYSGGLLSGFTHSAAELPELIDTIGRALWDDPTGAGENFVGLLGEIDQEALEQALPMMIEATREEQQFDNPHPEGTDDYEAYAQGWYEGYTLHFLASMAYGGTITKGATEGANVGQRVNRVADDIPASPALRTDGGGLRSALISHRLAEGIDDIGAQFRTAGKNAQSARINSVNSRTLDSLSSSQKEQLSRYLAEGGEDAVTTVNRLEDGDLQKLLGITQRENIPAREVGDFLGEPRNQRLVSDLNGELAHVIQLPRAEQRALRTIAYEGDRLRHVDDLSAREVARLSENGATLRETQVIAKSPAQGDAIRWMEQTDIQHAFDRHMRGNRITHRDETSLFPAGQTVDSPAGAATMPPRMTGDSAALRSEIEEVAYRAVKHSDVDNGQTIVSNQISRHGIESVRINVKSGQIESVYPRTGEAVRKFEDGQWWRWDPEVDDFVSWEP